MAQTLFVTTGNVPVLPSIKWDHHLIVAQNVFLARIAPTTKHVIKTNVLIRATAVYARPTQFAK